MSIGPYYNQPDSKQWPERPGLPPNSSFGQSLELLDLKNPRPQNDNKLSFAILGFCCDAGIKRNLGREGAKSGPTEIRKVLSKFAAPRKNIHIYDAGDIFCEHDELEKAQTSLGNAIAILLDLHIIPIVIGGGHEMALGHFLGINSSFKNEHLGIINFDAHFDMRPLQENKGNSGTPFLQIAQIMKKENKPFDYNCLGIQAASNMPLLFDTAKKYGVHVLSADDIHQGNNGVDFVDSVLDRNQVIYLSLCLDVFAAAYAPGVSAPQALGLTPWQVLPIIRHLAQSGKVISYDIAELAPNYDQDLRTTKLAAQFVYDIIQHHQHQHENAV